MERNCANASKTQATAQQAEPRHTLHKNRLSGQPGSVCTIHEQIISNAVYRQPQSPAKPGGMARLGACGLDFVDFLDFHL